MQHKEFAEAMLQLERAINKAEKIANREFQNTGTLLGYGSQEATEWYQATKAMSAMTQIKCMINIKW